MVRPALPGPPRFGLAALLPSSTCGSVKLCRPLIVEMTTVNRMTGRSSGTVIRKNVWTGPAPSTFAAS